MTYTLPEGNAVYGPADIAAAVAGADPTRATVTLVAGLMVPAVGNKVLIPNVPGLPFGMPARVTAVQTNPDGTSTLTLEQVALDEVLDDLVIAGDRELEAEIIDPDLEFADELDTEPFGAVLTFRAAAPSSAVRRAIPRAELFKCKRNGSEESAASLFSTGTPVSLAFGDPRTPKGGPPILDTNAKRLQLDVTLPVTLSIGLEAKSALSCSYDASKAVIMLRFGAGAYFSLTPQFDFEIKAAGKVAFKQTIDVRVRAEAALGSSPVTQQPEIEVRSPTVEIEDGVEGSVSLGGQAVIAAGVPDVLGGGVRGSFGPRVDYAMKDGCATANGRFNFKLTVFLDLLMKHLERPLYEQRTDPFLDHDGCRGEVVRRCADVERTTSYPTAVLADTPLAYYRLDEAEGVPLCDLASPNHPGTYAADGVRHERRGALRGQYNPAVESQGADPVVARSPAGFTPEGNSSFSLEGWFRGKTRQHQIIVGFGQPGTGRVCGVGPWAPSAVTLDCFDGHIAWSTESAGVDLYDGGWHHLVATYNAATATAAAYVDGAALGERSPPQVIDLAADSPVRVGGWVDHAFNQAFIGDLDEIAVYTGVLSGSRVAAHYAAAQPG